MYAVVCRRPEPSAPPRPSDVECDAFRNMKRVMNRRDVSNGDVLDKNVLVDNTSSTTVSDLTSTIGLDMSVRFCCVFSKGCCLTYYLHLYKYGTSTIWFEIYM